MQDDNGILAEVPGTFNALASQTLPPAETATEQIMWAVVDTGPQWRGLVRIRYRRERMRHGKHGHWAWVSEYAERAG